MTKVFLFIRAVLLYMAATKKLKKRKKGSLSSEDYLNLSGRILQRDFPELAKKVRSNLKQNKSRSKKKLYTPPPSTSAQNIYDTYLSNQPTETTATQTTGYEEYPVLDALLK